MFGPVPGVFLGAGSFLCAMAGGWGDWSGARACRAMAGGCFCGMVPDCVGEESGAYTGAVGN